MINIRRLWNRGKSHAQVTPTPSLAPQRSAHPPQQPGAAEPLGQRKAYGVFPSDTETRDASIGDSI